LKLEFKTLVLAKHKVTQCIIILKTCYGYDVSVRISFSNLLPVYLFRFQLHLLFVFPTTTIMVNKDYQ